MSASQLTINYKGALAAMRIDINTVAQMMAEEPRLLQLDPLVFKSRVEGMMSQLYLPRKQVGAADFALCESGMLVRVCEGGGHAVAVPVVQAGGLDLVHRMEGCATVCKGRWHDVAPSPTTCTFSGNWKRCIRVCEGTGHDVAAVPTAQGCGGVFSVCLGREGMA
eukprot:scaffold292582_cov21-Tisochrysis_lutea.AAC.1